jgi:hypothetical protein
MFAHTRKPFAKRKLDGLISKFAESLTDARKPFWRLIHVIRSASRLLTPFPDRGRTDPLQFERILQACVRIAHFWQFWQRQPEIWTPPVANSFVQFRSLLSHLFDRYPVPSFMAPVWFHESFEPWQLDLYLHLAAGRSIRQFELPRAIRISKQAACYFMQAPDDLCPNKAIRWALVRSYGGDDRLARLLLSRTILDGTTEDEVFWESVIRFLIKNGPISADEVVAIVQFIHQQRFQPAELVCGPRMGQQPLQPRFTLRGRSLMSLRRHMANWRSELRLTTPPFIPSIPCWERTAISPFRCSSGDLFWSIDELLTSKDLLQEGHMMKHCVASYIHVCAHRQTSIWSMQVQKGERKQRVLTIEVNPSTRTIRQAKGRRNLPPCRPAMEMLQQWATQEDLKFEGTA